MFYSKVHFIFFCYYFIFLLLLFSHLHVFIDNSFCLLAFFFDDKFFLLLLSMLFVCDIYLKKKRNQMRSIIVMNFACFMMSQCFVCFSSFFVCFGKNKTRMKFNTHHGYLLSTKQKKIYQL